MYTASQADVLVPQGRGSILAQRIIIIKPHRSKGFIKQNMSWAFGSSCPQSGKHTFKFRGTKTLRFLGAGRVCDKVCTCVCRERWHKLTFSFPAYFIGGNSDSAAEVHSDWGARLTQTRTSGRWVREWVACVVSPPSTLLHSTTLPHTAQMQLYDSCMGHLHWTFLFPI